MSDQEKAVLVNVVAKWMDQKKAGTTRWGSEKWMKDRPYYAALDTTALALECFTSEGSRTRMTQSGPRCIRPW